MTSYFSRIASLRAALLTVFLFAPHLAAAEYRKSSEFTFGKQRVVLGIPHADLSKFLKQGVLGRRLKVEALDVVEAQRRIYYNVVLGPRGGAWWVSGSLRPERAASFIKQQKEKGFCIETVEPFYFNNKLRFAVLFNKRNCGGKKFFIHVVRNETFPRNKVPNSKGEWENPPTGHQITSIRSTPVSKYKTIVAMTTERLSKKHQTIDGVSVDVFNKRLKSFVAAGRRPVDIEATTRLVDYVTGFVEQPAFSGVFAAGSNNGVIVGSHQKVSNDFRKISSKGKRIKGVTGQWIRSRRAVRYMILFGR